MMIVRREVVRSIKMKRDVKGFALSTGHSIWLHENFFIFPVMFEETVCSLDDALKLGVNGNFPGKKLFPSGLKFNYSFAGF